MTLPAFDRITDYRRRTYRLTPDLRIHTKKQAIVVLVNERGFMFFWPVKAPSCRACGPRPVTAPCRTHDDPGHVTWG